MTCTQTSAVGVHGTYFTLEGVPGYEKFENLSSILYCDDIK